MIAYGEEPNLDWGTRGRGFESRHSDHFPLRRSLLSPTQRNQTIRRLFPSLDASPRSGRLVDPIRIIVIMEPQLQPGPERIAHPLALRRERIAHPLARR
jgi:hypothetical protein